MDLVSSDRNIIHSEKFMGLALQLKHDLLGEIYGSVVLRLKYDLFGEINRPLSPD